MLEESWHGNHPLSCTRTVDRSTKLFTWRPWLQPLPSFRTTVRDSPWSDSVSHCVNQLGPQSQRHLVTDTPIESGIATAFITDTSR